MKPAFYRALPGSVAQPVLILDYAAPRVDQGPFSWRVVNDGVRVRDIAGNVWVAAPFQIEPDA